MVAATPKNTPNQTFLAFEIVLNRFFRLILARLKKSCHPYKCGGNHPRKDTQPKISELRDQIQSISRPILPQVLKKDEKKVATPIRVVATTPEKTHNQKFLNFETILNRFLVLFYLGFGS